MVLTMLPKLSANYVSKAVSVSATEGMVEAKTIINILTVLN